MYVVHGNFLQLSISVFFHFLAPSGIHSMYLSKAHLNEFAEFVFPDRANNLLVTALLSKSSS